MACEAPPREAALRDAERRKEGAENHWPRSGRRVSELRGCGLDALVDPVSLPLEGIGGQRNAALRIGREKTGGIDLDACNPEPAYCFLQEGDVRRRLRLDGGARWSPLRLSWAAVCRGWRAYGQVPLPAAHDFRIASRVRTPSANRTVLRRWRTQ